MELKIKWEDFNKCGSNCWAPNIHPTTHTSCKHANPFYNCGHLLKKLISDGFIWVKQSMMCFFGRWQLILPYLSRCIPGPESEYLMPKTLFANCEFCTNIQHSSFLLLGTKFRMERAGDHGHGPNTEDATFVSVEVSTESSQSFNNSSIGWIMKWTNQMN